MKKEEYLLKVVGNDKPRERALSNNWLRENWVEGGGMLKFSGRFSTELTIGFVGGTKNKKLFDFFWKNKRLLSYHLLFRFHLVVQNLIKPKEDLMLQ